MSIRSPGARTPTLAASAQASTVPAQTGVPGASPVARAAAAVTVPAISMDQASRGAGRSPMMSSYHGWCHRRASMSYSGTHWLAVWWSMTYSPVSRRTTYELELYQRRARAQTAGSCRRTHRAFGPTACEVIGVAHRSSTLSAPYRPVNSSISAVARMSMP